MKGKCQYIEPITGGLTRSRNPSKETMKRKITEVMALSKKVWEGFDQGAKKTYP